MQSLCTVEFFEKQPPETYGIKLDTIENDKSNEADDTEKSSEKAEAEQDIHFHIDLGKKIIIFYHLKAVKELILNEIVI